MVIDRPEDFFRTLHPVGDTSGQIIIERKMPRSIRRSQIWPKELERISKLAYGVPDLFFSTASFSGLPLALNFEKASCLHLQIPEIDSLTFMRATQRLGAAGIPLPTAALSDGEFLTLLWVLDKPIPSYEFYLYSLLQKALYKAALEFRPTEANVDITFSTRLVGSINSTNGKNVVVCRFTGHSYKRIHLEKILLSNPMPIHEFQHLQTQAGLILELQSLLGDRFFELCRTPEHYQDWILFVGCALCHFVTQKQLQLELQALAESLEGRSWPDICANYATTISSLSTTALDGYIHDNGNSISTRRYDWVDLICGKLEITEREISELNLQILAGTSSVSPHIHAQARHTYPLGLDKFEPLTRLLLKEAS